MKRTEFTDDQIRTIVELYIGSPRSNMASIGRQFGVSSIVIDRVLREQGIPKKTGGFPVLYPIVDGQKQCSACRQWKPLGRYSKYHNNNYRSDCKECRVKERVAKQRLAWYGVSPEQYASKAEAQQNLCAICGKAERRQLASGRITTDLVVDHDHETGQVRDLLCTWCNRAIGFIGEDPQVALAIHRYLTKWKT